MEENKPIFITNSDEIEKTKKNCISYVNAFENQVKELFFIENKDFIGTPKEEAYSSEEFKKFYKKRSNDYTHVFYPWNNHLIKTVTKDHYLTLKTNRNRDLITEEEQEVLSKYTVAVLGLSVGSNIAFTLTQAGISNKIILADFDELDTTNLNRILAGVHQVGLPKTTISSRRIYEDNPFADVELLTNGVSDSNIEKLLKEKNIDCLIDEIDNIELKIKLRIKARAYSLPVVMITDNGDGIVLHVERYDLGHDKIFGKPIDYWGQIDKSKFQTKDGAGGIIVNDIVGGVERVDPKMIASVQRVLKRELVSWSQLGSAALLGAVYTTVMIKKIALDESTELDIRYHLNLPTTFSTTHSD